MWESHDRLVANILARFERALSPQRSLGAHKWNLIDHRCLMSNFTKCWNTSIGAQRPPSPEPFCAPDGLYFEQNWSRCCTAILTGWYHAVHHLLLQKRGLPPFLTAGYYCIPVAVVASGRPSIPAAVQPCWLSPGAPTPLWHPFQPLVQACPNSSATAHRKPTKQVNPCDPHLCRRRYSRTMSPCVSRQARVL